MNKKFYFVLSALLCAGMAFAQEIVVAETEETVPAAPAEETKNVEVPTDSLGIHPWDGYENDNHIVINQASHWSLYLAAGFNVFDGDFTSEKKHGVWVPDVSLGTCYHWNNTWGTGVEYKFRNYRVTGSGKDNDADIMLKGMAHQAWAYVSFDIFNAFRPQNKSKLFALDILLGGGAVWKKNSIYYPNVRLESKILRDTPWEYNTANQPAQKDDKYKCYGVFVGGVSAEFNINRSFQLGLRGLYNYTTADDVDGRPYRGQNNDAFFDCEVLVRYKFEPRQKSNVRNFMTEQKIDNWNNGTYYKDPAMGAAKRAKYIITPQKDTLWDITRDTVFMMPPAVQAVQQQARKGIRDYVVFFENDVPELDNMALSIAGEAAMLLKSEPDYKAVVVGSCDNTGAVEYNKWLATERSENVTKALAGMGVSLDRIYNVGRGIMQDDRDEGSYSLNRRVEIHIVTDEGMAKEKEELSFFEQYKNVPKGSAVRKPGEGKNVSSSKALKEAIEKMKAAAPTLKEAVQKVVNEVAPAMQSAPAKVEAQAQTAAPVAEVLDKVVVTPNTTLSQLAKQYYGNGNLWVKIFEANRDRLTSPDHLEEGVELIIPKLNK